MLVEKSYDLAICVDCLMMLANGELGQGDTAAEDAHAEKMAAQWGDAELTLGSLGVDSTDDDDERDQLGFSWSSCEGCGSTFGGDRFAATAWVREGDATA